MRSEIRLSALLSDEYETEGIEHQLGKLSPFLVALFGGDKHQHPHGVVPQSADEGDVIDMIALQRGELKAQPLKEQNAYIYYI